MDIKRENVFFFFFEFKIECYFLKLKGRRVQLPKKKMIIIIPSHFANRETKCLFGIINFVNLFYYSAYFWYYLWVPLHFLVLFMGPTILF